LASIDCQGRLGFRFLPGTSQARAQDLAKDLATTKSKTMLLKSMAIADTKSDLRDGTSSRRSSIAPAMRVKKAAFNIKC
jgi:hypothetical protein